MTLTTTTDVRFIVSYLRRRMANDGLAYVLVRKDELTTLLDEREPQVAEPVEIVRLTEQSEYWHNRAMLYQEARNALAESLQVYADASFWQLHDDDDDGPNVPALRDAGGIARTGLSWWKPYGDSRPDAQADAIARGEIAHG